jgi:hypothetical protein
VSDIDASCCRYRLIYRDAHRDVTIQHDRVRKLKEGDKQFEAEVNLRHPLTCSDRR